MVSCTSYYMFHIHFDSNMSIRAIDYIVLHIKWYHSILHYVGLNNLNYINCINGIDDTKYLNGINCISGKNLSQHNAMQCNII